MGPRTFLSVREFPWYHLSAVCGSSARQLTGDSSKRARATGCVPREPHAEPLPLWPLLTRASAGDSDPGLVSLCGVSGSRCAHKVLFEPDKSLWRVRGLILNVILPLLPSYWCFSFAPGQGVSPHSCSSAYHLTGVFLTLDMGYLHTANPAKCSHCS